MFKNNKFLYISSFYPGYNQQAGQMLSQNQIQGLSINNKIDLIILTRSKIESNYKNKFLDNIFIIKTNFLDKILSLVITLFLFLPIRFFSRFSFCFLLRFKKINLNNYKKIILDFTQSFWIIFFIPRNILVELNVHDIQTVYFKRHYLYCYFLFSIHFFERCIFNRANFINVMSHKDKSILTKVFNISDKKIKVIDHKLSRFTQDFYPQKNLIVPFSILFWGAMGRPENYEAVINFVSLNFIFLLKKFPTCKLFVVGSSPHKSLIKLKNKFPDNIVVTGFLEDPSEYFHRASIGIAPLKNGAGIKYKVLEMLTCGLTVLSTSIGAEGIKHDNLLILNSIEKYHVALANFWNNQQH